MADDNPHLPKRSACLQCRRRKVKCDALRPHCTSCRKSYSHITRMIEDDSIGPAAPTCTYETDVPFTSQVSTGTRPPLASSCSSSQTQLRTPADLSLGEYTDFTDSLVGQWTSDPVDPFYEDHLGFPPQDVANKQVVSPVPDQIIPDGRILPLGWPKSLPALFIMEHLIQTWFSQAPHLPHMINQADLLARIQLPCTHANFPQTSLLHAICAAGSAYTAWVYSLPPDDLPFALHRHAAQGLDTEYIGDFGLSQAEASQRAIRSADQTCLFAPSRAMFETIQASVILTDYYYTHGFAVEGLILSAVPGRMCTALRLTEQPIYDGSPPGTMLDKLNTTWNVFVNGAVFSICNYWMRSMPMEDMRCFLPGSHQETATYRQTVVSEDLYRRHPVTSPFTLVVKAATIISRAGSCLRYAASMQDEKLAAMRALIQSSRDFHSNLPAQYKDVMQVTDNPGQLDCDIMMIHMFPSLAVLMLYDHLQNGICVERSPGLGNSLSEERDAAYDAVLGLLHTIPSNFDVSLLLDSSLAFCIYTVGRLVISRISSEMGLERFGAAQRYLVDLLYIQDILKRYGYRFMVGSIMAKALSHHLEVAKGAGVPADFPFDANWPDVRSGRTPRHDFFPCVYNDAFVEPIGTP